MPYNELDTSLPPLTPPTAMENIAAAIRGQPSPKQEFEKANIERRIAEAGLQQKGMAEKRAQADHRLKQFGALSTIAKVIHSLGPIPDEAKEAMSKRLSDEAVADDLIITDQAFFRTMMNQPSELAKFLDTFKSATEQGADPVSALAKGAQDISDPETQKLIGESFQKVLGQKEKQGKAISPSDVDAMIASDGKVVGETIPIGFTLPMAKKFQLEQREKRQILVPDAFAQALGLAKGKAEALSSTKAESELADLNSVDTLVGTISSLANSLITAETSTDLVKQAAMLKAGSLSRTNPAANAYEAQSTAFVGTLARALGGERGVLTDRDIFRVSASLPAFTDTKRIKDYKLGTLKLLVEAAKESKQARVEGRPTKSSEDKIQKLLQGLSQVESRPSPPPGAIPLRQ